MATPDASHNIFYANNMKFKDWINLPIKEKDILLKCCDPRGHDADNPIYPIGCAEVFNKYITSHSTNVFTNHPNVNSELLLNAFSSNTDRHRASIARARGQHVLLVQTPLSFSTRRDYASNLNGLFISKHYSANDHLK